MRISSRITAVTAGILRPFSGGYWTALDAATGTILWKFASGGSVVSAPAVVGGLVLWGSGYWIGTENNKLYAVGL